MHFLQEVSLWREAVPSFDQYPFNLPAVRSLNALAFHPKVTFLVGENGSGKSTLMEAIAVAWEMNAEGGGRNFNFATRASHSNLHEFLQFRRDFRRPRDTYFLRAESFFNVATEIERLDNENVNARPLARHYGRRPLHEQSHGESFFALFENRFGNEGLYLMDEPEAALSPLRQMTFLTVLHDLVVGGSQFVIATHSPIIMAYPNAWIYLLGEGDIRRVEYRQTEHYKATKDFLTRTDQMLKILLSEDEPKKEP